MYDHLYFLGTIKELENATCKAMQCKMYNITLLDARKHSHGEFHEAGFTLITLDQVVIKWTDWIIICCFQETKTQNWRANSEDIHLFQEQMEPYLMKMYPQTKVWCTLYNNIHSHFTAQCLENHLVYPPDKRWYTVWRPTKVNWEKLSEYLNP